MRDRIIFESQIDSDLHEPGNISVSGIVFNYENLTTSLGIKIGTSINPTEDLNLKSIVEETVPQIDDFEHEFALRYEVMDSEVSDLVGAKIALIGDLSYVSMNLVEK